MLFLFLPFRYLARLGTEAGEIIDIRAFGLIVVCVVLGLLSTVAAKATVPMGVSGPTRGLYESRGAAGCCWLGPAASFSTIAPPSTDVALIRFVIPKYAYGRGSESLEFHWDSRTKLVCCLRTGDHAVVLPFRGRDRARSLSIAVIAKRTFVPADRGINQDKRALSILLIGVEIQDSLSGARYVGGQKASDLPVARWRTLLNATVLMIGFIAAMVMVRRDSNNAWVAILLSAPFSFAVPLGGTTVTLSKVVMLAVLLALATVTRPLNTFRKSPAIPLFIVMGLFVLESLIAGLRAAHHADAMRETLKNVEYFAVFGIVLGSCRQIAAARVRLVCSLLAIVVSAGALLGLLRVDSESTVLLGHIVTRAAGALEGPNQLAAFLGILLIPILASGWRSLNRTGWCAVAISLVALALTMSRGGLAAFCLSLALLVAFRHHSRRAPIIIAACGVLIMATLVVVFAAGINNTAPVAHLFGGSGDLNGGLGTRPDLWHAAIIMWAQHPLLGVGPGNFEFLVGAMYPGVQTHANSHFLNVLAEQGASGLLLFIALIVLPLVRLVRRAESPLCLSGIVITLTFAFHQCTDGLLIYPKVGLVYWTLLAIALASASTARPADQSLPTPPREPPPEQP